MLYTHDLAGNFTALNRMGEQLTGYTRDELLALNISHIVAPEHLDLIQPMLARTRRTPCHDDRSGHCHQSGTAADP